MLLSTRLIPLISVGGRKKKPAQHKLREPRCIAAPWGFCCCCGSIPVGVPIFRAHLGSNAIGGIRTLWLTAGQAVSFNRTGIVWTYLDFANEIYR